jgi:hypothetical protein
VVPVTLHSKEGAKRFPLYAIPDSGADTSCFPEDWADVLGFDLKDCKERRVITGAGIGCHYESQDPLRATIADLDVDLCACFGPVHVALLGRDDFFRYFRVEFDQQSKITVLRAYSVPPWTAVETRGDKR